MYIVHCFFATILIIVAEHYLYMKQHKYFFSKLGFLQDLSNSFKLIIFSLSYNIKTVVFSKKRYYNAATNVKITTFSNLATAYTTSFLPVFMTFNYSASQICFIYFYK